MPQAARFAPTLLAMIAPLAGLALLAACGSSHTTPRATPAVVAATPAATPAVVAATPAATPAVVAATPAAMPAVVAATPAAMPAVVAATPAATLVGVSGATLFCATGSVGLRPHPLPPGYDAEYVVVVVDLDNAGKAMAGVSISALELRDTSGGTVARMRRLQEVGVFASGAPMPGLGATGSWAFYSDQAIPTFKGKVARGHTRLRVKAWLDVAGHHAKTVHLTLSKGARQVTIEGAVTGSFPS